MKEDNGFNFLLYSSIFFSILFTCFSVILRGLNFGLETIGVAKSAPRSNKSFCISDITLAFFLEIACLTIPKIEFNSSTDP